MIRVPVGWQRSRDLLLPPAADQRLIVPPLPRAVPGVRHPSRPRPWWSPDILPSYGLVAAHLGLTSENSADGSATTITCTRTVTAPNALIMAVAWANNTTCTMNHGDGAYTSAIKVNFGTTDHLEVFFFLNSTGGAKTITATFSGGSTYRRINGHEVSGLAASGTLDQTNGATGTGTALSAGNITTTQDDEYVFAAFSHFLPATFTAGSGWTAAGTPGGDGFNEYRIPTATGTFTGNCTASASADWIAAIASFKADVGAGRTTRNVHPWHLGDNLGIGLGLPGGVGS